MDRKKELKQQYKEIPIEAGVYQIKNMKNQKVFVSSTRNFKTLNGEKFMLESGTHTNKALQEDWNHFGKEAFTIETLEVFKKKDDPYFNEKEALAELEKKWLENLQPYEEQGYNVKKSR
ncbi:GIY-YIG nuclease family protein [Bacillus sp. DTU_2020_1000418_1_SI_GHA_SEK_038]|uniref:GIY-YIG nuclease family protein n=1 Tax=Bacillus sp. DTU_2020_1000418_1_SI_GHA_SEK_038 TaxID=3077585 RepID=UPI0028EEAFF1|nr:GIY-YIG nuclease family protein [Bacillus sp. DTU_2020_1000418_1_SI_GHA_SEK_038]WNS76157.1 GIY-YIG nuclease family protein [Bacillus sp. DTU_2020_1000418_1_SI_GHA_SEK_038]